MFKKIYFLIIITCSATNILPSDWSGLPQETLLAFRDSLMEIQRLQREKELLNSLIHTESQYPFTFESAWDQRECYPISGYYEPNNPEYSEWAPQNDVQNSEYFYDDSYQQQYLEPQTPAPLKFYNDPSSHINESCRRAWQQHLDQQKLLTLLSDVAHIKTEIAEMKSEIKTGFSEMKSFMAMTLYAIQETSESVHKKLSAQETISHHEVASNATQTEPLKDVAIQTLPTVKEATVITKKDFLSVLQASGTKVEFASTSSKMVELKRRNQPSVTVDLRRTAPVAQQRSKHKSWADDSDDSDESQQAMQSYQNLQKAFKHSGISEDLGRGYLQRKLGFPHKNNDAVLDRLTKIVTPEQAQNLMRGTKDYPAVETLLRSCSPRAGDCAQSCHRKQNLSIDIAAK